MKTEKKKWHDMTTLEKAKECERLAENYRPGPCLDQVLKQAADLRAMAEKEKVKIK